MLGTQHISDRSLLDACGFGLHLSCHCLGHRAPDHHSPESGRIEIHPSLLTASKCLPTRQQPNVSFGLKVGKA